MPLLREHDVHALPLVLLQHRRAEARRELRRRARIFDLVERVDLAELVIGVVRVPAESHGNVRRRVDDGARRSDV